MSGRINSHTISHAENLFSGDAYQPGANDGGRGLPIRQTIDDVVSAANIAAADVNGIIAAAVTPGIGLVTLNGALVTAGVAILTPARAVQIVSTGADTTQTARFTGTDQYGAVMVEDIAFNGTTPVLGLKAFKTVTSVSLDIALAGNLNAGDTLVIGLNYRVDALDDLDFTTQGGDAKAVGAGAGTLVVADTTVPATAITGDVRGTVLVDAAPFPLRVTYMPAGRNSVLAYGVPQFAG